eukprot:m.12180 g.12180  ORF g.12180 m.12180 type:complete len:64 (-) comp5808_c0_seq1:1918-2109(-)
MCWHCSTVVQQVPAWLRSESCERTAHESPMCTVYSSVHPLARKREARKDTPVRFVDLVYVCCL